MAPRSTDARQRMLASTVELLREHGASATTIDKVLAASGAPRGSVYHHFPGGRAQLLEEAVTLAGGRMHERIEEAGRGEDPVEAVTAYLAGWGEVLRRSGFRSGCPIVAVAVETSDDAPQLARTAGQVFVAWQASFAALLEAHGVDAGRSRRLAALIVSAVEGAVVLVRAQQDTAPLDDVAAEVRELVADALRTAGRRPAA